MTINRAIILREFRDLIFFLLASVVQSFFMCARCTTWETYLPVIGFNVMIWILLWKGNGYLASYLSRRIPWLHYPVKRMIVGVISTVVYTLVAILGLLTLFENAFHFNFGRGYYFTIYFSIAITIVISLVLHSRAFLLHWRQASLEAEKYQRESITAKYENLKSQVNPHFLFNSLNALTNLVYEDPDKAVKFIKQLSEVYRYVLDTREKEVVPLAEEVQFVKSYTYLQTIRFGESLNVTIDVADEAASIAPLALQMLIENAIKHNVVSQDDPLTVNIGTQDGYIVVRNTLQRKNQLNESSGGVGLENISKRYTFLSDKPVVIQEDAGYFEVRLPLLH